MPAEIATGTPASDADDKRMNRAGVETQVEAVHPSARIEQLFHAHFADTQLGHHTAIWNAAVAFKDAVKKLVAGKG